MFLRGLEGRKGMSTNALISSLQSAASLCREASEMMVRTIVVVAVSSGIYGLQCYQVQFFDNETKKTTTLKGLGRIYQGTASDGSHLLALELKFGIDSADSLLQLLLENASDSVKEIASQLTSALGCDGVTGNYADFAALSDIASKLSKYTITDIQDANGDSVLGDDNVAVPLSIVLNTTGAVITMKVQKVQSSSSGG